MTYNGWKNYETWAAALWMDNDSSSYDYWLEAAENTNSVSDLADQMKNEFEEFMPELSGVWSDLLTAAFGEIDWYEIAEAKIEDAKSD